jgi:hypothetical protein
VNGSDWFLFCKQPLSPLIYLEFKIVRDLCVVNPFAMPWRLGAPGRFDAVGFYGLRVLCFEAQPMNHIAGITMKPRGVRTGASC